MKSYFSTAIQSTISIIRDKLVIPHGQKSIEISTSNFITIKDLASYLKSQGIDNLKISTIEGKPLPESTHIQQIKFRPFQISINEYIYKVVPSGTVCNYSVLDLYDLLNMSASHRTLIQLNVRTLNNFFSQSDLIEKDALVQLVHNNIKIGKDTHIEQKKRMINLQCERAEMLKEYLIIKEKSEWHAWKMLWIGFWVSVFQCSYIGIGTYMVFSWDFMEPQAYAINLGNFIFAYASYTLRKQEISRENVADLLARRKMNLISKRQGFDLERFNEITQEIKELKKRI